MSASQLIAQAMKLLEEALAQQAALAPAAAAAAAAPAKEEKAAKEPAAKKEKAPPTAAVGLCRFTGFFCSRCALSRRRRLPFSPHDNWMMMRVGAREGKAKADQGGLQGGRQEGGLHCFHTTTSRWLTGGTP